MNDPLGPRFKTDCDKCEFVERDGPFDVWRCPNSIMTGLVWRYGAGPDYTTMREALPDLRGRLNVKTGAPSFIPLVAGSRYHGLYAEDLAVRAFTDYVYTKFGDEIRAFAEGRPIATSRAGQGRFFAELESILTYLLGVPVRAFATRRDPTWLDAKNAHLEYLAWSDPGYLDSGRMFIIIFELEKLRDESAEMRKALNRVRALLENPEALSVGLLREALDGADVTA